MFKKVTEISPVLYPKCSKRILVWFIFFDFETSQDSIDYEYIPNLCVALTSCNICIEWISNVTCVRCGADRTHVFREEDTVAQFCHWFVDQIDSAMQQQSSHVLQTMVRKLTANSS
jgi:hypothetical protein